MFNYFESKILRYDTFKNEMTRVDATAKVLRGREIVNIKALGGGEGNLKSFKRFRSFRGKLVINNMQK